MANHFCVHVIDRKTRWRVVFVFMSLIEKQDDEPCLTVFMSLIEKQDGEPCLTVFMSLIEQQDGEPCLCSCH